MWELDCEEGWEPKNWCFWTVVLENTVESPLDCKEIQPVHSERDQPWDFFGRNDAEAATPVRWPPDAKGWLTGKDSDAGRDWGQEEKGMTEDGMAGWHHWLDGLESQWTLDVGDGLGGLACCDSWGCKESDTTERLIWSGLMLFFKSLFPPVFCDNIFRQYIPLFSLVTTIHYSKSLDIYCVHLIVLILMKFLLKLFYFCLFIYSSLVISFNHHVFKYYLWVGDF